MSGGIRKSDLPATTPPTPAEGPSPAATESSAPTAAAATAASSEPPVSSPPVSGLEGHEEHPDDAAAGAATPKKGHGSSLTALSLGALGVVYGDIGTSPLYAIRECFSGKHGTTPTPANVLGVLSLVFWALVIIISVKYLAFIMRADNRGEGGILSLMSLVVSRTGASGRQYILLLLGLFGAALLYGDGMITPAISVLSAVEGLEIVTTMSPQVIQTITVVIIIGIFLVQPMGTARVGAMFGPVMAVWFAVIAILGLLSLIQAPGVLRALNPVHGVEFFAREGRHGFLVLGAVFLVVTGGEALYADMGHFGARPIRIMWFAVVLPSLLLNYFGQGALLLRDPSAADNLFYKLAPTWAMYPLLVLATSAAIIASQALISASFSLTRQAVQLGFSPRVDIVHTSSREIGQIYVPVVNWTLMIACIGLVLGFKNSSALAAAYGIAVTTTMSITAVLFFVVARKLWAWSFWRAAIPFTIFFVADIAFWSANALKIPDGGWFPLAVGATIFTLFTTWKRGREILAERLRHGTLPLEAFLSELNDKGPVRVPGTAVFMSGAMEGVPHALLHNLKHNKVLHERNLLLTIVTEEVPHVAESERLQITPLAHGFVRLIAHYGFMEGPDIPELFNNAKKKGVFKWKPSQTTFFLGRETLIATKRKGMAIWRERLFATMSRNAKSATSYFNLPPNRVVELGAQIEL